MGDRNESESLTALGRNMHMAWTCHESAIKGLRAGMKERDVGIEQDDSVGVFLDTDHDRRSYYFISVNSLGISSDKQATYGRREEWNPEMEVKTSVEDKVWTIEMKIPFSELGIISPQGQTWGINLVRNHRAGMEDDNRWYSSLWNYPGHKDPHIPHRFGSMRFE